VRITYTSEFMDEHKSKYVQHKSQAILRFHESEPKTLESFHSSVACFMILFIQTRSEEVTDGYFSNMFGR